MADQFHMKLKGIYRRVPQRNTISSTKIRPLCMNHTKRRNKIIFNIITPCSRPNNLIHIYNSIINQKVPIDSIKWWIVFDLVNPPFDVIKKFPSVNIESYAFEEHNFGNAQRNFAIRRIQNGWVYFVDDDNIIHPDFLSSIMSITYFSGIIVNQVHKNGTLRLKASSENTVPGVIDTAQFIIKKDIVDVEWMTSEYCADGFFINNIYCRNREKFIFIDKPLSYYNFLR